MMDLNVNAADSNNNVNSKKQHSPRRNPPLSVSVDEFSWKQIIQSCFSVSCLFYSVYTSAKFIGFLSGNVHGRLGALNEKDQSFDSLIRDAFLVLAFCFLHSFLASNFCKRLFSNSTFIALYRSLYLVATGASLQALQANWITSHYTLWNFINYPSLRLVCSVVQVISWVLVLLAMCVLDLTEFFGMEQVCDSKASLCPFGTKTTDAKRYLSNARHPTVVGLLFVFWCVPCMSMDRFMLSTVFSIYLFSGFHVSEQDYKYVIRMYKKKHSSVN